MTEHSSAPVHAESIPLHLATPADAERLAELGARLFAETFAHDNDPDDMRNYLAAAFDVDRLRAELGDASRAVTWLAIDPDGVPAGAAAGATAGTAVGYATIRRGGGADGVTAARPAEVQRLYVERRWHGRAVAPRLMQACVDQARRWSCDALWLGVWERNPRAIAFYAKQGFQTVGSQSFTLGRDIQRDLVLVRPL